MLKDPAGKELKTEWKRLKPDEVEVKLPLQDAQPGLDDAAGRRSTASRSLSRSACKGSPRRADSTASRFMPAMRKAC